MGGCDQPSLFFEFDGKTGEVTDVHTTPEQSLNASRPGLRPHGSFTDIAYGFRRLRKAGSQTCPAPRTRTPCISGRTLRSATVAGNVRDRPLDSWG